MITAITLMTVSGLFGGFFGGGGGCANGSCSAPSASMSAPMMAPPVTYSAPPVTYSAPRIIQSAPPVTYSAPRIIQSAPTPPPPPPAESFAPVSTTRRAIQADPNRPSFVKRDSNGLPVDHDPRLVPARRPESVPVRRPSRFAMYENSLPVSDTYGFYNHD